MCGAISVNQDEIVLPLIRTYVDLIENQKMT